MTKNIARLQYMICCGAQPAAACFHMKYVFCNAFFKGLKKIDNPYLLLYSI